MQEQFLAQARELLLQDSQHTESVVVGQPLPLDAEFLKRVKENRTQVRSGIWGQHEAGDACWNRPATPKLGPMLTHILNIGMSAMIQILQPLLCWAGLLWCGVAPPVCSAGVLMELNPGVNVVLRCVFVVCLVSCRLGSCWTLPPAGTQLAPC